MPTSRKPHGKPASSSADGERSAADAGLVYVSDLQPGIARRRAGRGFRYVDSQGEPVRDAATLDRIRALAASPAYHDVWICPSPRGRLQATGRDARGRKRYRYHRRWQQVRGVGKFDRIVAFATALPHLRRTVREHLAMPGFPPEKVLATFVAVRAKTLLAEGTNKNPRGNRSSGLTPLPNPQGESLPGGRPPFPFPAKGGQSNNPPHHPPPGRPSPPPGSSPARRGPSP